MGYLLSTAVVHLQVVVPYGLVVGNVDPAHGHRMYDRMKPIEHFRALLRWELIAEFGLQVLYYYGIYRMQGFVPALCFFHVGDGCERLLLFFFYSSVTSAGGVLLGREKEGGASIC